MKNHRYYLRHRISHLLLHFSKISQITKPQNAPPKSPIFTPHAINSSPHPNKLHVLLRRSAAPALLSLRLQPAAPNPPPGGSKPSSSSSPSRLEKRKSRSKTRSNPWPSPSPFGLTFSSRTPARAAVAMATLLVLVRKKWFRGRGRGTAVVELGLALTRLPRGRDRRGGGTCCGGRRWMMRWSFRARCSPVFGRL